MFRKVTDILSVAALLSGLVVILGGCCAGENGGATLSTSQKSKELNIAFSDDSTNLNPFHPNFFTIGRFLSGTPMRADSSGNWQPQVASTVAWSERQSDLIIVANPDYTFADGTRIRPPISWPASWPMATRALEAPHPRT